MPRARCLLSVIPLFIAGCSKPHEPGSAREVFAGVNCSAVRPQAQPDLLAWEPESRVQLDKLRRQGVVAVRYEARGCEVSLELLPQCIGPRNRYVYSPLKGSETKVAHDLTELVSTMPVGAANVASLVKESGEVRADMKLVGSVALPAGSTISEIDLVGPECRRATHVIGALYVGGFALAAGQQAKEGSLFTRPPGGNLKREGDPRICERAQTEGIELSGCSVPLRVGLVEIGRSFEPLPQPVKREATNNEQVQEGPFDQASIERVVRDRQGGVKRRCWDTTTASLRRVTVSVAATINPHGRVVRAEPRLVESEGPADVANVVARCIGGEIQTWQFPEPESERLVTLPFHLMRQ